MIGKQLLSLLDSFPPLNLRNTAAASQHYWVHEYRKMIAPATLQHLRPFIFFGKCGRKDSQRENQLLYLREREAPVQRNKNHRAHPWVLCASPLCALKGLFVSHTHTPGESL